MRVSVVATTFNRSLQLRRGIWTLLNQSVLPDELIIVDDGSIDDTKQICDGIAELCKVRDIDFVYVYLPHPEHRISSIPRNVGIKKATGDIVVFTESECLHIGDTLKQLLTKLELFPDNTPVATQVWSMGQRVYEKLSEEDFQHPARLLSHPYAMLVSGNMQNTNAPDSDFGITGSIDCLTGCLFVTKKQWLEDVGGFDEDFEGHGWDDWDLFNRLAAYGKGIFPCNDIAVIHQWHPKDYPYNIYDAAEKNGKASALRLVKGEYRANIGKNWGGSLPSPTED